MILKKDILKLMINSFYGKTMENLRKRINARLVNKAEDFLKYTSKPTYITHKMFVKDYAAIHEIKPVVILNKPTYVGYTVLDFSKWKMYDLHDNFIKKSFNAELLFTDTDSFTYEVKSENVYEKLFKWKDFFDFSSYSTGSKLFNETSKKVIGKIKDEFGGVVVNEFVGLKSKMFSIKKTDRKEHNTAKGVTIATEFKKFKGVLFNKKNIRHKMNTIQSENPKLGTYEIDKISLSCCDNKRHNLDGGIHTLAYFHKDSFTSCKEIEKDCND